MFARWLNGVIRFSLEQRMVVTVTAAAMLVFGAWEISQLPIDVFPDLDRPRVVIMTEAPGYAPEEVETLITFPLETAINGAMGVEAVRTSSGVGLSVVNVEFDWGTDVFNNRQIVAERLALAAENLPPGVTPQLSPISSIMGQIMIIGLWSEDGRTSPMELRTLADWTLRQRLLAVRGVSQVFAMGGDRRQFQVLIDPDALIRYGVTLDDVKNALAQSNANTTGGYLDQQGPTELLVRSLGRIQTVEQIRDIVVVVRDGLPVLVNQVARVMEGPEIKRGDSAAFARRPDAPSARSFDAPFTGGPFTGGPAVLLTINKQPNADTVQVTRDVTRVLDDLKSVLPADVQVHPELYQQKLFIDLAVENVADALRDGGILVVVVLFLFLLNLRTTFITLTAIPLSLVTAGLVFTAFGLSINTMTLGGLAVAIGELVDDAIVDVENSYRRLRLNRLLPHPRPPLWVLYESSVEIRNSIVFGNIIVVLVFAPVFALSGMEGRLFAPLGVAYIVSILASLAVSLTVTPALSYWLLVLRRPWPCLAALLAVPAAFALSRWAAPSVLRWLALPAAAEAWQAAPWWLHGAATLAGAPLLWSVAWWTDRLSQSDRDWLFPRVLRGLAGRAIALSLRFRRTVLATAAVLVLTSIALLLRMENDFLPPFDEGALQINVLLPPGTSLAASQEAARGVERRLMEIDEIVAFARKTGRAELDEHAVPVSTTEFIAALDLHGGRDREDVLDEVRAVLADIPGIVTSVEQPLAHLISHMLSGVQAQVAVKLYGDDLAVLRRTAQQMHAALADVRGVVDLQLEPQIDVPQLRIELDGEQLRRYGLRREQLNALVETAMLGDVVSEILIGQQMVDLLVRLDDPFRENVDALRRLAVELPDGGRTTLDSVARIYQSVGPNTIQREQVRRRIVIQCNTSGRGLVDVVHDIKARLAPIERDLPAGYFVQYGGQFESQQTASRKIAAYFAAAVVGMFLVLYAMFRSANLSLQVMVAIPLALIGSVAALILTGQTLTVAAIVGFVSLGGTTSRNGILLINHYLHLMRVEGETLSPAMIVRAGQERVAPVLMTALTTGIGLAPLALAAGEPGKEILYPVATVVIGGLFSGTLLEFFVRPALFWGVGRRAVERILEREKEGNPLAEAGDPC